MISKSFWPLASSEAGQRECMQSVRLWPPPWASSVLSQDTWWLQARPERPPTPWWPFCNCEALICSSDPCLFLEAALMFANARVGLHLPNLRYHKNYLYLKLSRLLQIMPPVCQSQCSAALMLSGKCMRRVTRKSSWTFTDSSLLGEPTSVSDHLWFYDLVWLAIILGPSHSFMWWKAIKKEHIQFALKLKFELLYNVYCTMIEKVRKSGFKVA